MAIGQQDYQPATCAGTLTVERGIRVEVWQTKSYTLESPIEEVVNVPLLPTHILVYPLVLRAQCDSGAAPTVGKLRRLLSEHMKTRTQNHGGADEEDEVAENDTTTIGSVSTEEDDRTQSEGSETEMDSDTDDEMDGHYGSATSSESGEDSEDDDVLDEEDVAAASFGGDGKRRRVDVSH